MRTIIYLFITLPCLDLTTLDSTTFTYKMVSPPPELGIMHILCIIFQPFL